MKKKLVISMVALLVLALSFAMAPKKANAIPAFAQKYHFSCAVCHTVFPNLNPFGRAFWRNGFRLPGTNGTPADATQITEGLSLPNPWPVPVMVEPIISYQHYTNENVAAFNGTGTDTFGAGVDIVDAGAFKLYTPLADSLSFYVHYGFGAGKGPINGKQIFASLNGLGSGFGLAPHLLNLKLGQVTTASPYFYRQNPLGYLAYNGIAGGGQGLGVGYDGEAGNLIHARQAGFALYGTPGFHLWYKVTVTNDAGGNGTALNANTTANGSDNAMDYTYQLKEYAPTPMGQFEIGYYGATAAQPTTANSTTWNNRVMVNGIDVDLANDIYELGATYMLQSDSNPYGPSNTNLDTFNSATGINNKSNGYSEFEIYGRYLLPQIGNGLMLTADYATYSWTHKATQEAFNESQGAANTACPNANLYSGQSYSLANGCSIDGVRDSVTLQAEYNLAYNAHLYVEYLITNNQEADTVGTGLDFAF
ncbi:MAG: hypothetical protein ACYCSQ_07885 [bacterium]